MQYKRRDIGISWNILLRDDISEKSDFVIERNKSIFLLSVPNDFWTATQRNKNCKFMSSPVLFKNQEKLIDAMFLCFCFVDLDSRKEGADFLVYFQVQWRDTCGGISVDSNVDHWRLHLAFILWRNSICQLIKCLNIYTFR